MKRLKENVYAIQVGCQICRGAYLDKDSPLNEEVKSVKEVKYGEFESSTPKGQDPGSFILPCSIGKLDFNNALADLGASISIMPLSMYKHLGIGKLKPINMVTKMADNTKCTPKGIVENLLVKIYKFIFSVDFMILDMVEDLRIPIILGRTLLSTAHAKESYEEIVYRITEVAERNNPDLKKEGCIGVWRFCKKKNMGASSGHLATQTIIEDKDDLDGILDYLEPRSYNGFIELDDEAYNKRRCELLGMTYMEPTPSLMERVKVTRHTIGPGEIYAKVNVLGVDEIPRNMDNIAAIRAK
nr:hypothetical protein [Tanacetum cinerariifolium]